MRLYVIGPVTGRENFNRAAFEEAKEKLWDAGYDVLIPHDVIPPDASHEDAMRLSIKTMLGCDGVAMLTDWYESTGATLEKRVAEVCGIETHYVRAWFRKKPDCPENDSTRGRQNPLSDGARTPSDEVLDTLTRRMDETNALLRAVYYQIAALAAIGTGALTKSTFSFPKNVVDRTLGTASDCLRASKACFESAGKESQDGEA